MALSITSLNWNVIANLPSQSETTDMGECLHSCDTTVAYELTVLI